MYVYIYTLTNTVVGIHRITSNNTSRIQIHTQNVHVISLFQWLRGSVPVTYRSTKTGWLPYPSVVLSSIPADYVAAASKLALHKMILHHLGEY